MVATNQPTIQAELAANPIGITVSIEDAAETIAAKIIDISKRHVSSGERIPTFLESYSAKSESDRLQSYLRERTGRFNGA